MEFEMNPERQRYITSRGKIIVNACPGSGKTTSVAYKLKDLVSNWDQAYSGIACLSFTNVAKDEINDKFHLFTGKSLNHPHLVSTIDSFINQYITLPHYQKVLGYSNRPIIIEDYTWIDNLSLQRFKLGTKPIQYIYKPSKIDINHDGSFLYDGNSLNLDEADNRIFLRYCKEIKRIQFQSGLLKNSDSLYAAHQILSTNPNIARYLCQRFPYIIIDEAQDTSELQHLIFDKLIINGLANIELIGDPYQSLYEWREARPDLFLEKLSSGNWLPLDLLSCKRSVQPIVNAYSLFRMQEHNNLIGQESQLDQVIHIIYFENYDQLLAQYEEISTTYIDKKILVRGASLLESLKASVKLGDYWKETPFSPLQFIRSKSELDNGDIKAAINRMLKLVPLLLEPTTIGNDILKNQFYEENKHNYSLRSKLLFLIRNIPDYTLSLIDWTNELKELCKHILNLIEPPPFTLKAGKLSPYQRRTVSELYSQPVNSQKVTTIHKVKGKTFDSIMLVLSANSSGQNLSINDFKRPTQMPGEKKRLLYVAMSRPKWQLVIGIPKAAKIDEKLQHQLFGNCQVHEL
ncbi:UvrD-helicase domain-containing protein [Paenibacillus sp. 22594]|uniref:UvrD-helicase domain-containing protein n=1 Tax=Paenibacillus sp. 22594 TaxID=3453947 RepID=UPI003F83AE94